MTTALLLLCSNVFMTVAWYGHLKYGHAWPLWQAILVSWAIALVEYCFAVPANRLCYGEFSGFQLKIIQVDLRRAFLETCLLRRARRRANVRG